MNHSSQILVVGAGVIGLSSALAMAQQGLSVAILHNSEAKKLNSTRVYAINLASQELFKRLGVWETIVKPSAAASDLASLTAAAPYTAMQVWEAQSQASLDFNAAMVLADQLGWMTEEATLVAALTEAVLAHPAIQVFDKVEVRSLRQLQEKNLIEVSSANESWQAELLLIADGANSACREFLKIPITQWSYHQLASVAKVRSEKPHQQTAMQVFNRGDILAFLPLQDPYESSIVWSSNYAKSAQLLQMEKEEFEQNLTASFQNRLGKTKLLSSLQQFPLTMRHSQKYCGERWILLGDAAHSIHPLAGLGLNVGLADLTAWLSYLNPHNLNSSKAKNAYQRHRKAAVWPIIIGMDAIKTLMGNNFSPIKILASLGLSTVNRLTPLKRFLIEQASGLKLQEF